MKFPSGEKTSYSFYRVLRSIWTSDGISRSELADSHGLDKASISHIVSEFSSEGLVCATEVTESLRRRGRKPELLAVRGEYGMVAGLELRPDYVSSVALDLNGSVFASFRLDRNVDRSNIGDSIEQCLAHLREDERCAGIPLVGVGVGVPGVVARSRQSIVRSIALDISDPYDFAGQVGSRLDVPAIVDNDANCCAWGEIVFSRALCPDHFVFALLRFHENDRRGRYGGNVGLGLGFVLGGQVYYGADGSAGEFRSALFGPEDRGQFATVATQTRDVRHDPEVLDRLLSEISVNLAMLVNTFNLKAVYVGGDVDEIDSNLNARLRDAIATNWSYDLPVDVAVETVANPQTMVAAGAGAMVLEEIFAEPKTDAGISSRNKLWRSIVRTRSHQKSSRRPASRA